MNKEKILTLLEQLLHTKEHVILISMDNLNQKLVKEFIDYIVQSGKKEQYAVLASEEYGISSDNDLYYRLSKEEEDYICNLYYTYEFSDHFMIICNDSHWGELLHYVESGLADMKDVIEAICC